MFLFGKKTKNKIQSVPRVVIIASLFCFSLVFAALNASAEISRTNDSFSPESPEAPDKEKKISDDLFFFDESSRINIDFLLTKQEALTFIKGITPSNPGLKDASIFNGKGNEFLWADILDSGGVEIQLDGFTLFEPNGPGKSAENIGQSLSRINGAISGVETIKSAGIVFSGAALDIDTADGDGLRLQGRAASSLETTAGDIYFQAAGPETTGTVQVGSGGSGSSAPDLLALDVKSNSGDPIGFEGAMYYNKNTGKFRCYESGSWKNCISNISSYIHLIKTSGASQNIGGQPGIKTYISWDGEVHKDSGFKHSNSNNNTRIQVEDSGRYSIKATLSANSGGTLKTETAVFYEINGGKTAGRGKGRSYFSDAGIMFSRLDAEADLKAGDYIEIISAVESAEGDYEIDTNIEECEMLMRKLN